MALARRDHKLAIFAFYWSTGLRQLHFSELSVAANDFRAASGKQASSDLEVCVRTTTLVDTEGRWSPARTHYSCSMGQGQMKPATLFADNWVFIKYLRCYKKLKEPSHGNFFSAVLALLREVNTAHQWRVF